MSDTQRNDTEVLAEARRILQGWLDQQSHDRCWYYPDVFVELAKCLGVERKVNPNLPPIEEFRAGCERYRNQEYRNLSQ
jgi:hypothetical protein